MAVKARGRGIATEALGLFVAEMFRRGAEAVYAEVRDANGASIRVVQKAGFRGLRADTSDEGPVGAPSPRRRLSTSSQGF